MRYILFILLTACSTTPVDISNLDTGPHTFKITFVDRIVYKDKVYRGMHTYEAKTNIHHMFLPKDDIGCLAHEVMHILDKDFHKGRDSIEYCMD